MKDANTRLVSRIEGRTRCVSLDRKYSLLSYIMVLGVLCGLHVTVAAGNRLPDRDMPAGSTRMICDPDAGPDQELCNLTMTTMAAVDCGGGYAGSWSIHSGSCTIVSPGNPVTDITNLIPGTSVVLVWEIVSVGAPSPDPLPGSQPGEPLGFAEGTDTVVITVYELPTMADAGTDQDLCNETGTELSANTPAAGTGLWSVISGTADIIDPTDPLSQVGGLIPGMDVTLRWTISSGTCTASFDEMEIHNDELPTTANAGVDQDLCEASETDLEGNTPAVGTGTWTYLGFWSVSFTASDPTTTLSGLNFENSFLMEWTITNGICPPSTDQVLITNYESPTQSVPGLDQIWCNEVSAEMGANNPLVGTGMWSLVSGSATIDDPSDNDTQILDLIPGDTVVLAWTITNGSCPPSSEEVTIYNYALPTTANAGPDQMLCNVDQTILAGNDSIVGTGEWSLISGLAFIVDEHDPSTVVNDLVVNNLVTLEWTITNGTCPPSSDQMTIQVDELPTAANAGADLMLCNETGAIMNANFPSVGTGTWNLISGTANITSPNLAVTPITGLIPGETVVLEWSISNGSCPPSVDQMVIYNYALPTPANAGPDQEFCESTSFNLAGNTPVVGTGTWTKTSGQGVIMDIHSPTSLVTNMFSYNSTFEWTIENGTCPASVDEVEIVRHDPPGPTDAGPDQYLCDQTMTTLAGESYEGSPLWTVLSGTANFIDPMDQETMVTGLIPGMIVELELSNTTPTCPVKRDTMFIYNDENPTVADAGPDQIVCNVSSVFMQGNVPLVGSGMWSVVSGPAVILDPTSPVSEVTVVPGTTSVLEWTISNGVCPASIDQVAIQIDQTPTIADAGPDQELCDQFETQLEGNTPVVGVGVWTLVFGDASILDPVDPQSPVTGLTPQNPAFLKWSITNGVCPASEDYVFLSSGELPDQADAGPDQELCGVTYTSMQASGANGVWELVDGICTIDDVEDPFTDIFDLQPGVPVILRYTIYGGYCPDTFDEVMITMGDPPTPAEAGEDQVICNETEAVISGNTPIIGEGVWSVESGYAEIFDPMEPNTFLEGLLPGSEVVLRWTIYSPGCDPSIDELTIHVAEAPTPADAGMDQLLCDKTFTTLNGNTPVLGTGFWSVISGMASIADPTSPTTIITDLALQGTAVLRWTVSLGICPPSIDEVTIETGGQVTTAAAGPDQILCGATEVLLEGNVPVNGTGSWSIVSGNGTLADPLSPSSKLSGLNPGSSVVLEWTISGGNCAMSTDQVTIQIDAPPSPANAGDDQIFCNLTSTSLAAESPAIGTGLWKIDGGMATVIPIDQPDAMVTDLIPGQVVRLIWTVTNGSCPTSQDTVLIQVDALPDQAMAGPDQTICDQSTATVLGNLPAFGDGTWSVVNGPGTVVNPISPMSDVTGLVAGETTTLRWTISSGTCPETIDDIQIQVDEAATPAEAGMDQALCEDTETIIAGNAPLIGSGTWNILSGNGMLLNPAMSETTLSGLILDESVILVWTIVNGSCSSSDTLKILSGALPSQAMAGEDQALCGVETILDASQPLVGEGQWSVLTGSALILDPNDPQSSVSGLIPGSTVTLVWTVTSGGCPPTTDEVILTVDADAPVAEAGEDQQWCGLDQVTLDANPANVGSGMWSIISGTGMISDPGSPVSSLSGLLPGSTVTLRWTVSGTACPEAVDEVVIQIDAEPSDASAGQDVTICTPDLTLDAEIPVVGQGIWSVLSGQGMIQDISDPNSPLTGLLEGESLQLEWAVVNGVCPKRVDSIWITREWTPTQAMAGVDQTYCDVDVISLDGNVPEPGRGQGIWTLLTGTGQIVDPTNPLTQVIDVTSGVEEYVWTISNGVCPPSSDTIQILIGDGMSLEADFLVSETACTSEEIHFIDITEGLQLPVTYYWDFGDNTTSDERDPVHQYTQAGEYEIVLTLTQGDCVSPPLSKSITVFPCSVVDPEVLGNAPVLFAHVYPNPSISDFQVVARLNGEQDVNLDVFTLGGQIVTARHWSGVESLKERVDGLGAGMYIFRLRVAEEVLYFRVVRVD